MASVTAIAALLVAGPARGFDATGLDILGLRLGMPEPEVVTRLANQGYTVSRTSEAIAASTRDGQLRVALSTQRGVTEIRYIFSTHDSGALEKVRGSILMRFGDPNQAKPPAWCRAVGADGMCPRNQASLTFLPDSLTLLLRDDGKSEP